MGFGAVWGSPPYGAHTPELTGPSYSPGGPEKNSFYSEGIDPHLGEIWNFEIFNIAAFEPILGNVATENSKRYKLARAVSATVSAVVVCPSAALGLDSVHAECIENYSIENYSIGPTIENYSILSCTVAT